LAKKSSGIRINQLAKDLGVPSKAILEKLRDEGLGDQAPNHQSTISLGLVETIKEWFSHGGGGTAVETAAPVDVALKARPKTTRRKSTKTDEEKTSDQTATAEAAPKPKKSSKSKTTGEAAPETGAEVSTPVQPEVTDQPATSEQPVQVTPAAPEQPAADQVPTPVKPAVPAQPTPAVVAPAAEAPAAPAAEAPAPAAPAQPAAPAPAAPAPKAPEQPRQLQTRPTVTLADRQDPNKKSTTTRKPITPAVQFVQPEPARIQGPKLIREEKPDLLPTPRSRRVGPQPTGTPGFTQARPQQGRGVRIVDDETLEEADRKGKSKSLSSRRRGPDGRRGEAEEKLREFTDADLIERRERLAAAAGYRAGVNSHLKQRNRHAGPAKTIIQKGEPVEIEEPITVRSLSEALGLKSSAIISHLMRQGVFATINQNLDKETAELIAAEYGIELRIKGAESLEDLLLKEFEQRERKPENLIPRPPVVTILGHVDHGKTSLLDRIRKANVAAGEAGGITQHTAAWMVEIEREGQRKRVTFIDTPGHQAFTAMRARGANMTDVVVLVVSAAEGVQPQTIESINHAKAAEVPIVVAMNKIDRPDANEQKVLGELAAAGLNPVEWGGDTEVVRTSAVTGQGIEDLIEILDLQAELLELKSDPTAPSRGVVIESRVDEGLGPVATVLVQDGVLHVGDIILAGCGYGRIRSLVNDRGQMIEEAPASTPVIVSGFDELPNAGDRFYVLNDLDRARAIAEERQTQARRKQLASKQAVTLDNIFDTMKEGDIKTINLIIKADVQGSVETLASTVAQHNTDEVRVRVIHAAVGAITESDVELADASDAVIIGFHVAPDDAARSMAEQRRVEIRTYRVIYEIFDDLKKALSGMLEPEIREKLHGHAEIREVFRVSRLGNIAGCFVTDGHIQRGSKLRLIRDGVVINEDLSIETLRRVKDDVREVKAGLECGIKIAGFDDIKIGDRLEAYVRETIERHL